MLKTSSQSLLLQQIDHVFVTRSLDRGHVFSESALANWTQDKSQNLLFWACEYGISRIVTLSLQLGASIERRCEKGKTPLWWACHYNNLRAVRVLVASGADIEAMSECGSTALMVAAEEGGLKVVEHLLEAGAAVEGQGLESPLILAAYGGHLDVVRVLVLAGANLNATDAANKSACDYAKERGHLEVWGFLGGDL